MTFRLQYLKNMSDKQTLAEIPVRIVSRYIQNFKFFIHGVFSLFGEDKSLTATKKGDSNAPDKFGFKKSLILYLLRKANKNPHFIRELIIQKEEKERIADLIKQESINLLKEEGVIRKSSQVKNLVLKKH